MQIRYAENASAYRCNKSIIQFMCEMFYIRKAYSIKEIMFSYGIKSIKMPEFHF